MMGHYILGEDGRTPVLAPLLVWASAFERGKQARPGSPTAGAGWARVAHTEIGNVRVSTVFLGLDHSFTEGGPPVLFETLVFGGEHDEEMSRYTTWEDAEQGHMETIIKCGWKLPEEETEGAQDSFALVNIAEKYTDVTQGEK